MGKIKRFFNSFFKAPKSVSNNVLPNLPESYRVYAVGDIHGRADLLIQLHQAIATDAVTAKPEVTRILIYLGDYVDRGMQSREVIEHLTSESLTGFKTIYLKGNHDEKMLNFLDTPKPDGQWFGLGGNTTIYSYGVRIPKDIHATRRFNYIQDQLRELVPATHRKFLQDLELSYTIGDYFFSHAGINPDRSITDQKKHDLIWGKKSFLSSSQNFGKTIVHGHTVGYEPVMRANRICIDTGAFQSDVLTCLVLENDSRRFLSTGKQ